MEYPKTLAEAMSKVNQLFPDDSRLRGVLRAHLVHLPESVALELFQDDDIAVRSCLEALTQSGNNLLSSFKSWAEEKEETFFKPAMQAFAERMSATRQASKIKPEEVRLVLQQLNFELIPYAEQDTVEALLGAEPSEDEPSFWSDELSEERQREDYVQEVNKHIPQRRHGGFETHDRKRKTEALCLEGMTFPIKGRTDELISLRRYHDLPLEGAVAGIEFKKKLAWSAIYQSQAEWLLYAPKSYLPYCQFTTDLTRGGIAFYYSGKDEAGKHKLEYRVLVGMAAFWKFFEELFSKIPETVVPGRDKPTTTLPKELDFPKRQKFDPFASSGAGPSRVAALKLLMNHYDSTDDVACLEELAGFAELDPQPWASYFS